MLKFTAHLLVTTATCAPALGQVSERAHPIPLDDCGPMRLDYVEPDAILRQLAAKPLAQFDLFDVLHVRASTAELRRRLRASANPNICGGMLNISLLSAAALPSRDSVANVRLLIEFGAGLEAPLSEGRSALAFAVGANNYAVAQTLIERGANCAIRFDDGGTLLHELASSTKDKYFQPEKELVLAERLRRCDAPLDGVVSPERVAFTPLLYAILNNKPHLVEWLLANGADAKYKDAKGRDALALATQLKREAVLRVLASHP